MKKIFAMVLSFALLLCVTPLGAIPVAAATSGTTGDCTWVLDGTHLTISGNGEMGDYKMSGPWGKDIASVTIEDGVTTIGECAFRGCTSLTSVTIPDSVTSIGYAAFYDCDSLESVTIPDSVTTIGYRAFSYCTSLKSVTIPDSVTSIDYDAFTNTGYYNTASNWANGVLYIGNHLIDAKTSLSGSYAIKEGTLTIGTEAFYDCDSLESVTIPDSVTTIEQYAFRNCTSLKSVTIPDSVTNIGGEAFYNTGYYNTASNWENDILYIGNHIIDAKTSLSGSYTIREGTLTIGRSAFYYCRSLTSVTIPDSVTSIGDSAFSGCTSMMSIKVDENNPNYCSLDGVLFNKDKTTLIQCPGGKIGAYTILDSVTSIGGSAFDSCTSLTSVTIGDSVTTIGEWAFYDCDSLTSVTIPDSVTSIGDYAFHNCNCLVSAIIGDSVTSIGYSAFSGCTSLTTVTIGHSITTIGEYAFDYCNSLKTVHYHGTMEGKAAIPLGWDNSKLTFATWHYYDNICDTTCNECGAVRQIAAQVLTYGGSSISEDVNGLAFRFDANVSGAQVQNGNEYVAGSAIVTPYVGGESYKVVRMGAILSNSAEATLDIQHADGKRVVNIEAVRLCEWSADAASFAVRLINIPENGKDMEIFARPYYVYEVDGEEIVVYGDAVSQIYNEI